MLLELDAVGCWDDTLLELAAVGCDETVLELEAATVTHWLVRNPVQLALHLGMPVPALSDWHVAPLRSEPSQTSAPARIPSPQVVEQISWPGPGPPPLGVTVISAG